MNSGIGEIKRCRERPLGKGEVENMEKCWKEEQERERGKERQMISAFTDSRTEKRNQEEK